MGVRDAWREKGRRGGGETSSRGGGRRACYWDNTRHERKKQSPQPPQQFNPMRYVREKQKATQHKSRWDACINRVERGRGVQQGGEESPVFASGKKHGTRQHKNNNKNSNQSSSINNNNNNNNNSRNKRTCVLRRLPSNFSSGTTENPNSDVAIYLPRPHHERGWRANMRCAEQYGKGGRLSSNARFPVPAVDRCDRGAVRTFLAWATPLSQSG